jgi:hypothetical protein
LCGFSSSSSLLLLLQSILAQLSCRQVLLLLLIAQLPDLLTSQEITHGLVRAVAMQA